MKRMLKKFTISFSFVLFLLPILSSGQGYKIKFSFPSSPNSEILLAYYYFGDIYQKDTLKTDAAGQCIYSGDKPLQQGIYQRYFSDEKQLDFLVGEDQSFEFSLPGDDDPPVISSAWETEKFQQYVDFVLVRKSRQDELTARKEQYQMFPDSVKIFDGEMKLLDEEMKKKWADEGRKYPGLFYGKFVLSNDVTLPDPSQIPAACLESDSLRWVYEYSYRKNHYWDHYDLGDLRMWHTPTIRKKLDDYLNKVLIQMPDTVLQAAVELIEKYKDNKPVFQNLTSFILNNSIRSQVMGIENVFVALAEKYYLSGQAFWADAKTLERVRQEVAIRKNNLVGLKAPELLLEDMNGGYHSLKQSLTPYTVVVFWEPGCGHCQVEIPQLYQDVFLKISPSKLTVYAVYTMTQKAEWGSFIDEHELHDWINVWDPNQSSNFRLLYGVRTTPSIFLLDKDQKIIAKNMDVKNLVRILDSLGVAVQ